MNISYSVQEIRDIRQSLSGSVGFVPTMGCLHQGHLSLIRASAQQNNHTMVSIFVNPTQFGKNEDFDSYPRDVQSDIDLLLKEKATVLFLPTAKEIYPEGFGTWVDVSRLTSVLEGLRRPGHFRGVTTICNKLFNIVDPDNAYFGQKDAQQAIVIKKMVIDLNMRLKVHVLPTVRESSGLAMSSRNNYLTEKEREAAAVLYRSLEDARSEYLRGEMDTGRLRSIVINTIEKEPLVKVDYIAFSDPNSLDEVTSITSPTLLSLAAYVGTTRLIDNVILSIVPE